MEVIAILSTTGRSIVACLARIKGPLDLSKHFSSTMSGGHVFGNRDTINGTLLAPRKDAVTYFDSGTIGHLESPIPKDFSRYSRSYCDICVHERGTNY